MAVVNCDQSKSTLNRARTRAVAELFLNMIHGHERVIDRAGEVFHKLAETGADEPG
jgi:hypothetical protein